MTEPAACAEIPVEGPARDVRFTVVDAWAECSNFPHGHPLREIEFFHRQMNEEVDGLECAASNLSDFPGADWRLRLSLARQCADEARHVRMFRRIFESRGGYVGQYPVLNFQFRIITRIRSLVGRLAVQNRSFEAGGLDAIRVGIDDARKRGDLELAELFEAQRDDEITHVRFANDWIRTITRDDPRAVLQIGSALSIASKEFLRVMGAEGMAGVSYPADLDGRQAAGFTPIEVSQAIELQSRVQSGQNGKAARQ